MGGLVVGLIALLGIATMFIGRARGAFGAILLTGLVLFLAGCFSTPSGVYAALLGIVALLAARPLFGGFRHGFLATRRRREIEAKERQERRRRQRERVPAPIEAESSSPSRPAPPPTSPGGWLS